MLDYKWKSSIFLILNSYDIIRDKMKDEIVFESDRINFVKLSQKLVHDYLNMVNDIEVQKFISHKRKIYELDEELEWIKSKLELNAFIFSMIEKEPNEFIGNI